MTTKTTSTTNNAGVPPVPPEAHQRAEGETTVRELLKLLVMQILLATGIVVLAFWIDPVLGSITALFVCFAWLFIAPVMAGWMLAALMRSRRKS